jgi:hypothetical protein
MHGGMFLRAIWNSSGSARWFRMEYRGKSYSILQGIEPGSWRWSVQLNEKVIKSGTSPTRAAAIASVHWVIDKSLAAKKRKVPPPDMTWATRWSLAK